MRLAASALLVVVLMLPACAATDTPSSSPGASTPTGMQAIAEGYLDLVEPFNAATCRFNVVLSQTAPALAELKLASADYAATVATLFGGLQAITWPAENGISQDADDLISALVATATHAHAMAEADSMSSFIAADELLIGTNGLSAAAATQLRKDLGLGSGADPCTT